MIDPVPALTRHPSFAVLPADALRAVAGRAVVRAYDPGALVFLEGEPAQGLYIVASGAVRLFKASESGKEQDLYHAGVGDSFNDAAAVDGGPTLANAQALESSLVLVVGRDALVALLAQHPEFGLAMARGLAGRLRTMSGLAADLALRHLVSRVAQLLIQRAGPEPALTLPTRQKLAAMVGTVREVATRILKHLERRRVIRLEARGRISILDRGALERLARLPGEGGRDRPRARAAQKVSRRSAAATSSRRNAVSPRTASISSIRSSARAPAIASDELQT